MSRIIIGDSSGLFSLFIQTDQNHNRAVIVSKHFVKETGSLIIPSEVFSELINIIGKKLSQGIAVKTGQFILQSRTFIIEATSAELLQNALEKFNKQPRAVSFTDCLVMAFADEFETKEIFGFDEAFTKNGYIRIGVD